MKVQADRVCGLDERTDDEGRRKFCLAFDYQWRLLAYRAEQLKDEIDGMYPEDVAATGVDCFRSSFESFVRTADRIVFEAMEEFGLDEPYISEAIHCEVLVDFASGLHNELQAAIKAEQEWTLRAAA